MKPPIAYVVKHNAAPEHNHGVIAICRTEQEAQDHTSFELRYSPAYPSYSVIPVYDQKTLKTYREWNNRPRLPEIY